MNGPTTIEIIRPFSDAFELMKKILFQPFDIKKWFVIGFAAWLANLGGYNFNFRYARGKGVNIPFLREWSETLSQIPHWLIVFGISALIAFAFVIAILFAWLRARGAFMFIDCVVKNRGAIAEPWREFRKQGNSYFLFTLLAGCAMLIIVLLAALPLIVPVIAGARFQPHDPYLIGMLLLWGIAMLILVLVWALISHLMLPIMYRRRCFAREALSTVLSLIGSYSGEIALYCLFWIVLAIGSAIAACATILATCCIALLPYIGTVIMLPIFVCLRAYGLLFIRQFGPDYDVWSGIVQPPPLPPTAPPLPV